MIPLESLPTINAILNSTCAALLVVGYVMIRTRRIALHRACMISAFACSVLFLVGYLTYHFQVGTTRFQGEGTIREVYLAVLLSHTLLAMVIVPLVLITLSRALRQRFDKHKRIARWTLPIWLYVSVTGVVVYLMLYRI